MAINCKVSFGIFATFVLVLAIFMSAVQGQAYGVMAPAPAPTSDEKAIITRPFTFRPLPGSAIDQGIAYGLMLLALVLTYLIHSFDAPLSI
ncbi:hypothetical protein CASFOL_002432 [Castilleja foliolosa]|uniref:Uncharacterized protein n=1 Tax=Castilleja foliolosa TaxID=1961234 RepID=A0ABD3EHS4_9LAMI